MRIYKNATQPNLEKSTLKLEKRRESALILEKGLFKKKDLDAANTRNTIFATLWLREICPLKISAASKIHGVLATLRYPF